MGNPALTEAVYYILLSLTTPLHGYGIMQNVEALSGGRVKLAAGTVIYADEAMTQPAATLSEDGVVYAAIDADKQIAALPLPLAVRTALMAAATGFGGMAILMQNRAVLQQGAGYVPGLAAQMLWQAVHGSVSGLLALGLMQLWGE